MTVSSQTSSVAYSGDGSTAIFAVPFYFLADSHLKVILRSSAGSETVLVLNSDYTVTGAGNLSGGSITAPNEPQVGETLTILRNVPATQETDYVENDPFPAESHERALDKLTMLVQQNAYSAGRAIRVPDSDPEPQRLPPSAQRANLLFSFDATGQPIVVAPSSGSATDLALNLADSSDPLKGAAILGRGAQVVGSIAELRLLLKTSPSKDAFVTGYAAPLDGGGGPYHLDVADVSSPDDGGAVIVAADGGRWKLVKTGNVSVRQFGAVGDGVTDDRGAISTAQANGPTVFSAGTYIIGSNLTISEDVIVLPGAIIKPANGVTVTIEAAIEAGDYTIFDLSAAGLIALTKRARFARLAWFGLSPDATAAANTTAFNNAIDACPASDGIEMLFPAGTIQSNGFTVDKSGVTVTGHNAGTWLVNNTTNAPCIEVAVAAGKASWCHLRNLRIGQSASVAPVAGNCGVRLLRTDQTTLDDIVCFDFPDNLREGFIFEDADNTTVRNLKAINCTSNGFRWTNTAGGCTDTYGNSLLSYGNAGSGFRFEGCSGFYANNLHAYNNNHAFEWPTGFTNQFFFVSSWIGDTSASYNWLVQNLNRSAFASCWAATQKSAAVNTFAAGVFITTANAYDITFDALTAHNNNSHGVHITGSAFDITINGGRSTANGVGGSGSGYRIELATDITIQGARAKGNASNGFAATAVASDYLMIQNNNFRANTGASLTNLSTGLNNQVGTNIV